MARKDLLGRLADAGEDAIGRLGKAPGMKDMASFATSTRDRLDELTRRVRGIDVLEKRVAKLERRLDELSGTKSRTARTPAKKTTTRKTATTRKTSTARRGSTGKTGGRSPG